jgi:hypothetical protein
VVDEFAGYPSDVRDGVSAAGQAAGVSIIFQQAPAFAATSGTLRDDVDAPPAIAGHGIYVGNDGQAPTDAYEKCTLGFKVSRASQPQKPFNLTSGHCMTGIDAEIDSKVYYRGTMTADQTVGFNRGFLVTPTYDLGLVEMLQDAPAKVVVSASANSYRKVNYLWYSLAQGTPICMVGATSNLRRCGTVQTWEGSDGEMLLNIAGVLPGDSGGPVYTERPDLSAGAAGIVRSASSTQMKASNLTTDLSLFCSDCSVAAY